MACEKPLLAVNLGIDATTGKNRVKILPKRVDQNILSLEERYGHENLLLLPCGSCPSCKAAHKKEWSVRCSLEAKSYRNNCMVTLTYEERLRPKKLIKRDLQKFIKDMRNAGIKFRYFGCGEYGTKWPNFHPHYHILMFGFWPDDAKFEFTSKSGYPVYRSKFVEKIWHKGLCTVSEFDTATAMYVAGYVDKKLGQDEFVLMSKRPGIGEKYFREHLLEIYQYDNIVGPWKAAKVPRYCDKIADSMWFDLAEIKANRLKASDSSIIQVMMDHGMFNKEEVFLYKGKLMKDKLDRSKRL